MLMNTETTGATVLYIDRYGEDTYVRVDSDIGGYEWATHGSDVYMGTHYAPLTTLSFSEFRSLQAGDRVLVQMGDGTTRTPNGEYTDEYQAYITAIERA